MPAQAQAIAATAGLAGLAYVAYERLEHNAKMARLKEEVEARKKVMQEMREAQQAYEAAVRAALATGGATKTPSGWSHETIATEGLVAALAELRAFPRTSAEGTAVIAQAELVLKLRGALLHSHCLRSHGDRLCHRSRRTHARRVRKVG